jgi:hypothetical protein
MENRAVITVSREKILETYHTTPKERLVWLDEANDFLRKIRR